MQLLLGGLLLESLLLEGLTSGGGGRQVLRTEAEALQKLENSIILVLEQRYYVALCATNTRKLEIKEVHISFTDTQGPNAQFQTPTTHPLTHTHIPVGGAAALPVSSS